MWREGERERERKDRHFLMCGQVTGAVFCVLWPAADVIGPDGPRPTRGSFAKHGLLFRLDITVPKWVYNSNLVTVNYWIAQFKVDCCQQFRNPNGQIRIGINVGDIT